MNVALICRALLATFLLGLTTTYSQVIAEADRKPFHLSSRGSGFGVQAEFEGTYQINEESVGIYVSKATLYVSENCPYQGRRNIESMKFGLWDDDAKEVGKFPIQNQSLPQGLSMTMSPKEEYTLYDLYFTLPKESGEELGRRRLVVVIQTTPIDDPKRINRPGIVFAMDCEDVAGNTVTDPNRIRCVQNNSKLSNESY